MRFYRTDVSVPKLSFCYCEFHSLGVKMMRGWWSVCVPCFLLGTTLQEQLHQDEVEEQHAEVDSQGYLLGDWSKYREELEKIRQLDAEEGEIREELDRSARPPRL